eukprot:CAMPEP_0198727292 /NCGR_PEP_ID=MMETSP1475-20131203/4065_1 /TAXON_ID= ORGANISM="Unidentified sp., Strain CCMP1999" /NCGR_SAMPLE_ID=MMETSP1475 /ASSEMBLY_ACC=CAM_ASM_001111 /LENGTH=91 /DNA_ID=CAMNT_0044489309 /DNA_START=58 /DNA_END=333 /DNA_ORIENTATION=+
MGAHMQTTTLWVTGSVMVIIGWCLYTLSLHLQAVFLAPLAFALLIIGVPMLSVGLSGVNQEAKFEEAMEQLRTELSSDSKPRSPSRKSMTV